MNEGYIRIIRKKMHIIIAALFVSTLTIAAWSVIQLLVEQPYLEATDDLMERVAREDMELLRLVGDIRYDIVQVQQYFSDISATRGLDGLDDGFEQAQRHARSFESNLESALAKAATMNRPDTEKALQLVAENFEPYYAYGWQMAERYVAEGPSAGNQLMAEFDSRASALSESLFELLELIDTSARRDLLEMEESVDTLKENNAAMLIFAIFPAALGIIAAVFGLITVRRICAFLAREDAEAAAAAHAAAAEDRK